MSQTIDNLIFFCNKVYPKSNSIKLKDCNKTLFAKFLEVDLTTLSKWLNYQNPMSRTNLLRISNKASEFFKMKITPEIFAKSNLEQYIKIHKKQTYNYENNLIKMIKDNINILEEISFLLKKHPEMQQIVYNLLLKYDKK